jgi:bile acid:Na+ symporter, BASS family
MLERYLIVWLSLLSGVAYFWPAWNLPGDPFVATRPHLKWLIALTMFCVGSLMRKDELQQVLRNWPNVLAGTTLQYVSMPLFAYACAHLFDLEPALQIGVPGAMASNVLTLVARGNVSYSVSLTTCSTVLSPLVVPVTLYLALGSQVKVSAGEVRDLQPLVVAQTLLLTVVGPVVAGFFSRRIAPRLEKAVEKLGPIVAHLTILWIIAVVVALNRDGLGAGFGTVVWVLLAINLLGYGAGYWGGAALRFPEAMRRALTIEIGMQNAGLGTVLATSFFPGEPTAAIPTALYTFGCMFTATLLANWWAWRDRRAT